MLDIIYEDRNMIVVNKPAGQLVQSGRSFELDLTSEVLNYRREKGEEAYAAVINRLDRPVSGHCIARKVVQLPISRPLLLTSIKHLLCRVLTIISMSAE